MPTLHTAGFIAVDRFLSDVGVAPLKTNYESSMSNAAVLKNLFSTLALYGKPSNAVAKSTPLWFVLPTASGLKIDKFYYAKHQDHGSSHTFLLNAVIPVKEIWYDIWPQTTGEPIKVPIKQNKLVVLDGWHEQTGTVWQSVAHAVNMNGLTHDKRLRICI